MLAAVAGELELDAGEFHAALDSGRYADVHQQALRRALGLQITMVPTFLIEGRRLEGIPTAEILHQLLDSVALR